MYWVTLTLLIVLAYTVYRYIRNKRAYFEDRGVPCVGYPPFGSNVSALFQKQHITESLIKLYNSHPEAKYIGAFDFRRPMIFLRDPELIKTVAIKNFDSFYDHPPPFDVTPDPLFKGKLFNINGKKWREMRNLLTAAFSTSKMKGMHEMMVEVIKKFVDHVKSLPEDEQRMQQSKQLVSRYTNDVIMTCGFGIEVDSLKDPTNLFYLLGREHTNFDNMALGTKFAFYKLFPAFTTWSRMTLFPRSVYYFFEKVVGNAVKTREQKGIVRQDLIQLLMNARDKTEHVKLDLELITASAYTFFFGGYDTISSQICAMSHELALNPDIQRKLQNEIDEVMEKTNGNPSYDDIQKMLYLDAVFNETMRRHAPVVILDRMCMKPFELPPAVPGAKPFLLQPGAGVWIPVVPIHMDSKYYENPKKFDPERYYDKKVTINDSLNMGFGIGPRSCIANRFSSIELKIYFIYVLSSFNLIPNEKTCSPYEYNKGAFSNRPVHGFWLGFEPRKNK